MNRQGRASKSAETNQKKTIAKLKRQRATRIGMVLTKVYVYYRRKKMTEMYNLICDEMMAMGGVYIKFLQGVLLRSKIMRTWHNPKKLNILEHVPAEYINVHEVLTAELPPLRRQDIVSIQPEPFAAGSFGQVYYGMHRNGRPIIIKILRPLVQEMVKFDLRIMQAFAKRFFEMQTTNMDVDLHQALKDFLATTLAETDYIQEAEFGAELAEAYRGHPHLVIPHTYRELSTKRIIVQDYVGGISLAQVVRQHSQGVDPEIYVKEQLGSSLPEQLELVGYEAMIGIFSLPRIPGDPHPGNIRLLPDNKVGLIDFGISAPTPKDKAPFFGLIEVYNELLGGSSDVVELFEQSLRFFVNDLYRSLKRLGAMMNADDTALTKAVGSLAESAFKQAGGTMPRPGETKNILTQVNEVINKGNRFGFIMKLENTAVLRAAQTYVACVELLGYQGTVLPRVTQRTVDYVRAHYPEALVDTSNTMPIAQAVDIVVAWLERIADRDPLLFKQLRQRIGNLSTEEAK